VGTLVLPDNAMGLVVMANSQQGPLVGTPLAVIAEELRGACLATLALDYQNPPLSGAIDALTEFQTAELSC
jgi:hypothetical protein